MTRRKDEDVRAKKQKKKMRLFPASPEYPINKPNLPNAASTMPANYRLPRLVCERQLEDSD